ncbi:S41 family peptidase [Candidatus Neomarinimicrobiota bacterium]
MIKNYSKTAITFCLMLLFIIQEGTAQEIGRDELIEDVRQLADILETAHPDPYINGGGKVAFHRRLQVILGSIPGSGMTSSEFYRLLSPFVASIEDGHTNLQSSYSIDYSEPGGIPLYFSIIERSLYVAAVPEEKYRALIGAVLTTVEGLLFDKIFQRMDALKGTENEYTVLGYLSGTNYLWCRQYLEELIPEWKDKSKITVGLRLPSGKEENYTFDLPIKYTNTFIGAGSKIDLPTTGKCDFVYCFMDSSKQTAYLRIDDMSGYREAFEFWGVENRLDQAKNIYMRYNGKPAPANSSQILEGLPSVTKTFKSLVIDMAEEKSNTLIVDLRFNSGGNSIMTQILIYFLYGKETVLAVGSEVSEVSKYSDLYFNYFSNADLNNINANSMVPFNLAEDDYDFKYDYIEDPQKRDKYDIPELYRSIYQRMPAFYTEYESGDYSGYYCPETIVVLCSPQTFSSAYTLMYYLYRRGAIIVGTPSGQAGNYFGDILWFKLNHSGIQGYVSYKQFISFPDNPEMGRVLRPHFEITYEKLALYNFDPNKEVIYTLDLLQRGEIREKLR